MKCDKCDKEVYRLRCEHGTWYCRDCIGYVPSVDIKLGVIEKVKCGDGWYSKKRVDELERRVILPYDAPNGGYYVGRRGENGRIQEREPRYHG